MGELTLAEFDTLYTSQYWVDQLNLEGGRAPGGGSAYDTAKDDSAGIVGVAVSGAGAASTPSDYTVTVSRPLYGGFSDDSAAQKIVDWINI